MNVKSFKWFCLISVAFMLGSIIEARALEIVYPADGTYVTKSNYLIIKGGRDPFLDGIAIEINGVKSDVIDLTLEEYRAAFADMLLLEPLFDPGENRVTVEGYLNGEKFSVAEETIFYQDNYEQVPPDAYRRERFHVAEREAPCAECHVMQLADAALQNPGAAVNTCASCHARMLNKKHVHGPAGVFECLFCHDAESTPFRYEARQGDAQVCNECHEDKVMVFGKKAFVHGPVEAGMCLVCHDPHASDQPAQVLDKVNDLCLGCHSSVDINKHVTGSGIASGKTHPVSGPSNPARIEQPFHCASCHDPHAGRVKQLFINDIPGRMLLCQICHAK